MQEPQSELRVPWKSFWSLVVIQSMNSLNEKAVQFLLIALGIWMAARLQYPLSILIVLPFVLFSPLAGWVSDRYCKTRLLQAMVLLQVVVLVGMSVGLFLRNLPVTVGFFGVFCVQATFFSPAKKGLVKDIVGSERIGMASGVLEISSMLALLTGQIGALYIVYSLLKAWGRSSGWEAAAWPCAYASLGAVMVLVLSLTMIPRYEPQSRRPFHWSLLWEHFTQLRMLWRTRVLRNSEIGVGYFWFIAGVMMLIVLQMAQEAHPVETSADFMQILGQQKDSALLFAWLSGGSICGGLLASALCARGIRIWIAHVGGVGMTLGCLALAFASYDTPFFYGALFFTGFTASGYLVPLNALLQDRADNDKRGDVIAAGNLVDCFLGAMSVVVQWAMASAGLDTGIQCGIMAALSAVVAIYLMRSMRHVV